MSLIRLQNISKSYQEVPVLCDVFFRLSQGDRVGLIGKNGTGKTTVLRLILGREKPSAGTVDVNDGLSIGYFSQFSELDGDIPISEVLENLFEHIKAIETELDELGDALGETLDSAELDQLLRRQAALLDEMERCQGWTYHNRIDTVLTKLGFSEVHRQRPIGQLSGGWRNRAALAKMLLQDPEVLLLDEPTNYLDMDGLQWLEGWLQALRGALIIVSHDRHFLDAVTNRIVEIENYHFQEYKGNFTQYVREKPLRLKSLQRQFEHEEELLAFEAEAISDRQEAAKNPSKALQRRLAHVKKRVTPRPVDRIVTGIYSGLYVPNDLCRVERLGHAFDDRSLFTDLTFEIQRGDRLAIIGPNGCGKSTLVNILSEDMEPNEGRVVWVKGATYVYYNQILEEIDPKDTVTHAVNITGMAYLAPRKQVNRFLSLLQFSDMDLNQRIGTLSGGQRARVALAKCLLSGASVVVLDEPTNHLDLPSTQVIERALVHFPGAVVVVSHDRFFIDKVATRLLAFDGQGGVDEIPGNWTIWQASSELALA